MGKANTMLAFRCPLSLSEAVERAAALEAAADAAEARRAKAGQHERNILARIAQLEANKALDADVGAAERLASIKAEVRKGLEAADRVKN